MTSIDERVTKILDENPNIVEKFPDIFPVFAQKIAPTIEFLETKNISCRFMFAHAFGEGWSISAMLPLGNQETLVVSQSTKQQTFTLKEQGFPITEANTPETLLQYIQMRLASPSL